MKKSHLHDKRFEKTESLGDKFSQESDYKSDSAFVKIRAWNFNEGQRARASLGKFIIFIVL